MLLSTILTQKYTIIQIIYSAALIVILYVLYIQNEQIKLLMQKNTEILERLTDKEKELETLMNKISTTHTTHVDTLLIAQNNDVLKLCILIVGGVVVCTTGYYIFTNILQVFTLKKIIPPVSFYSIIQDFTPFCQTKSTYSYTDKKNNLEILAEIINEKKLNISVKEYHSNDFIDLTDFIWKITTNFTTTDTSSNLVLRTTAEALDVFKEYV